ncbi:hypothetical protein [Arthrobacter sp. HY1533]|uniref:hypothetical protein n=1 Tax=Arthrobacter sp. HY1533 TaxID=2970919 RepID=UPI0022B9E5DF|nr:hypothetical protein [Arthrobacter sp. HY1533]
MTTEVPAFYVVELSSDETKDDGPVATSESNNAPSDKSPSATSGVEDSFAPASRSVNEFPQATEDVNLLDVAPPEGGAQLNAETIAEVFYGSKGGQHLGAGTGTEQSAPFIVLQLPSGENFLEIEAIARALRGKSVFHVGDVVTVEQNKQVAVIGIDTEGRLVLSPLADEESEFSLGESPGEKRTAYELLLDIDPQVDQDTFSSSLQKFLNAILITGGTIENLQIGNASPFLGLNGRDEGKDNQAQVNFTATLEATSLLYRRLADSRVFKIKHLEETDMPKQHRHAATSSHVRKNSDPPY